MKEFEIPQRSVVVTLRLEDGLVLSGRLYVPRAGPGGVPGKLFDRLNDDSERFVPMAQEERSELIQKRSIVWARPADAVDVLPPPPPGHEERRVRLVLRGGEAVEGTVRFAMRPERSRVLDYFNAAPRFVALEGASPMLVNRRFIARVEDLSGDAP